MDLAEWVDKTMQKWPAKNNYIYALTWYLFVQRDLFIT